MFHIMKSERSSFGEFTSIFSRSFGAYKPRIAFLMLIGFVGGLLGSIGISAIIPLFSFVVGADTSTATDTVTRVLRALFDFFGVGFTLPHVIAFIILLFLFKTVFTLLASYLTGRIVFHYQEEARMMLLRQTFESRWPFLLTQKIGHLDTLLMKNVEKSTLLLEHVSLALTLLTSVLASIIVALNISTSVTFSIFGLGALMFLVLRSLPRRIEQISIRLESLYREVAHHVNESILGMKIIKARGSEEAVINVARPYMEGIARASIKIRLVLAIPSSLLEPMSIILIVGVFLFQRDTPGFSLAALAAVMYVVKQIFTSMVQLQTYILSFRELSPYARNILAYKDATLANKEVNHGVAPFSFKHILEFRNVRYTHAGGKEVLCDVSFGIKKGELVGLIGPSGAGKTTLVDLLLRLFVPVSGGIFVDGVSALNISEKNWRARIGYVPQEVFLRNATIAENIKFYDATVSDEAMIEAAKLANIYDFIESLPEKWNTQVGERGVLLSGGQKQRIGIAMALAQKPEIVIFDEATSALDNESEAQVKRAMDNMRGRVTVLAIAHRISTIIDADRIIALEGGRVIEDGSPKELLARPNSYLQKIQEITKQ